MVTTDSQIPNWLRHALTQQQAIKLSHLVEEAENHTTGEIVPVLVHRSTAVGHVKWILVGFFMAAFLALEAWYTQLTWGWHWAWLPIVALVLILFVAFQLAKLDWIQNIFTTQEDEDRQVAMRAELEFYRSHIKKTAHGTGILIFVSWMEKRAVVLADKGIADLYPPETWNQVIDSMVAEFKKGHTYEAFEVAIKRCGEILKEKLPASAEGNLNELRNHLVIRE